MKKRASYKKLVLGLVAVSAAITCYAGPALALNVFGGGPRAMGMGGANIASVNDTNAQYFNPAAFGFMSRTMDNGEKVESDNSNLGRKDWGIDFGVAAGIQLHQDFGRYIDDLANIDYDRLSQDGIQSKSDLADLVNLVNGLKGLDAPGNALTSEINLNLATRMGHFAIGARGSVQIAGRVLDVDTSNLGITGAIDVAELDSQIVSANPAPAGYARTLITDSLYSSLFAAGLSDDAINSIDLAAVEQGVTSSEISGFTETFVSLTEQTGSSTGDLADNTTTVALNGFGVAEVPISYGYAINDNWSIGGNFKIMQGRVYGTEVLVFDDNSEDVLSSATDEYQDTTTFGLDLALMGRYSMFSFGLIGRNLNSPEFDGFDVITLLSNGTSRPVHVDSVKLNPEFAAGIAFVPFETLTLEVDYDLTKNDTALKNYEVQNFSAGLEWDAFRFLALRVGAYKNMAKNDVGLVYTAGVGVNMWLMRLDIGAAYASESAEYDGEDYPKEARIAAQLSFDF
jgi:hypothetical protein